MPKHLSSLIEDASSSVMAIKVELGRCAMAVATSTLLTAEQKQAVLAMYEPLEKSIREAQSAFLVE